MRTVRHWTPHYVVSRLALMARERSHPDAPWFNAQAALVIESWLRPTDSVLEWGSGRSTAWFASRCGQLISVEHDRAWFSTVTTQLVGQPLEHVDRRLRESTDDTDDAASIDSYVGAADDFGDESLDLVLVDGLHRGSCALVAVSKVRPGGMLVIDDGEWFLPTTANTPKAYKLHRRTPEWAKFEGLVRGWRRIETTNGVSTTLLFLRP